MGESETVPGVADLKRTPDSRDASPGPDASFHFAATELAVVNASSPGTWPMQTKAYTGLVELGCEGDACKVLLTYDRLANGNDGPPPDGSKADAVFSMVVTVSPAQ